MRIRRLFPTARRLRPLLIRSAAGALALIGATFAAAGADAVFPPGSRIGLTPPRGFAVSSAFRGFEDRDNKALILLFELPAVAYSEIEKTTSLDAVKKQGLSIEKREDFAIPNGKAILFTGSEETAGVKSRKWLLFASVSDLTAAVNIQVPDDAKDAYPDAAIRAALTSLSSRAAPVQEQLGLLPFKIEDLAGFQVAEIVENRTVVLADDPKDAAELNGARMIVGAAPTPPIEPDERANFSRNALASLTAFKDMHVTFAEPLRIGGQQGFEVRVDAKHAKTGADVSIVQWMRFGTGAVLRIVGVAPKEKWASAFPRFRTVRDAVTAR